MIKRFLISLTLVLLMVTNSYAFWIWTPETNKWVNPKYAVKDTPQEQLQYSLDFYKVEEYKKAIKELKKLIKHFPRAREAADAQYYIGLCLEGRGDPIGAFKNYQIAIEKYPFSERSKDIVKKQYDIGNSMLEGSDERNKFIKAVVGGDYDVIEIFRTVIKNTPYGEYAAPSQYKIGLYLQEKQLYQEARDEFEKTVNDYPETSWAKAAEYQIAVSDAKRSSAAEYDQEITEAAIKELKEFVAKNPETEFSQEAIDQIRGLREKEAENHYLIAVFYQKQKKYNAAKIYYTTVVEDYKNTSWAPMALEKIRELNTK